MTDADQDRVLRALLAMQRHSWEQGVAGHAALDLGLEDLVTVIARDAVVRQTPYGSLGEMGEDGVLNGAANGEAVRWLAAKEPQDRSLQAALDAQVQWLVRDAPRAQDGTLFHLQRTHEVWADTVYMVVPLLLAVGEQAAALAQLEGHRSRLFDESAGLYAARWGEDTSALLLPQHWGTGNGWVVAGIARSIRQTGPLPEWAAHARVVIDACLACRRPDGIFHDVVDDPTTFAEANLAQMLAYAIFLGVQDGWLPGPYREVADDLVATARRHIDQDGLLRPVCGAPFFDKPGTSAEAQAFFLLATAAQGPLMDQLEVEPGLLLRRLVPEDAPAMFTLVDGDREALGEFLPWVDAATEVAESLTFIETSGQRWADGTGRPYGAFVDDELVGHVSLMSITRHQAEIGYWLVRAASGRGTMTRCVERLVRHAFDDLGLQRLVVRSRTTNVRSAAIPLRLGFVLEGTERHGEVHRGAFYDLDRYSLLATDRG